MAAPEERVEIRRDTLWIQAARERLTRGVDRFKAFDVVARTGHYSGDRVDWDYRTVASITGALDRRDRANIRTDMESTAENGRDPSPSRITADRLRLGSMLAVVVGVTSLTVGLILAGSCVAEGDRLGHSACSGVSGTIIPVLIVGGCLLGFVGLGGLVVAVLWKRVCRARR